MIRYYSLKNILKKNAQYNMIFGERSNGKTYSVLYYALENYLKHGDTLAVIRRYREDFRGKRGQAYFESLEHNGNNKNVIKQLSGGQFDRIIYNASKWYLGYYDEKLQRNVCEEKPFAYAFALSEMEHDKGNSYTCKTILFDEFITRGAYLNDEFVLFMNCISTIVRARDNVKIFMLANTVSGARFNPYFSEMGLKHAKYMQKGDIDIYNYGNSKLKVAVEYSDSPNKSKPSDVYFAFDNAKLSMITGGEFELDFYPHLTKPLNKQDIIFEYFIQFDDHILQADVVMGDNDKFTFIHEKTTPIKNPEEDIIFDLTPNESYNYYVNLLQPVNDLTKKIYSFFRANKVFYSTNEIGEVVNQYLIQCGKRVK